MTPDIYRIVAGRQHEILSSLGIKLNGRRHIRCPFPGHADQHPSWRWDPGKGRYFCTCGSGDIIGAVMKARDLDWRGAADYCRDVLGEAPFRANGNGRDHNRDRRNGSSAPPIAPVETPKTLTPDEWRRPPTSFPAPSIEDERAQFMTREAVAGMPDVMREHEYQRAGVPVFIKQRINGGKPKFRPFWRVDDRGDTWQNIAPDGFKMVPYVAPGRDPFTAGDDRPLFWCEGERDVDTLAALGLDAFTFGAAAHAPPGAELYVEGRNLVIPLDSDPAGQRDVAAKVRCATGHSATIKAISFPELASGGDVTDYLAAHDVDDLLKRVAEAKPAAEPTRSKSGLATVCAAAVEPETIDFLWDRRIARGKHTCIAGEGGLGKSQLFIAIAAAITTEATWPCKEGTAPLGNVVILSAEDGVSDVLVPRLIAAGADLTRVHIVQATIADDGKSKRKFDLRTDLEKLKTRIKEIGDVVLVGIDPVSSYMGDIDSHSNTKLRSVLDPVSEMAEDADVAVVSITHFNKPGSGPGGIKAMHRVMGGAAFTTAPRAAFAVIEDPDDPDRRLFLHLKNNLGPKPQGLAFRLEQRLAGSDKKTGEDIVASRVVWDSQPVTVTADEAMSAPKDPTAKDDAVDFLRTVLAGGPVKASELEQDARDAGFLRENQPLNQSKPFRSAKGELGVITRKDGMQGGWTWALPE